MSKGNLLIILVISAILTSCTLSKLSKTSGHAIIAISASSTGLGSAGSGIIITLMNLKTRAFYRSKSFSPLSKHSAVNNVPPGSYIVYKVELPVGGITYSNWSEPVHQYFGQLEIEADKKYYLGYFLGRRKVGRKNVLKISLRDQHVPIKIRDRIENEKTGWGSEDFVKVHIDLNAKLTIF